MSHGSALECASDLDLLVKRRRLDIRIAQEGKATLVRIVSMLIKLIDRLLGPDPFR